jgi:hypothetical protein
MLKYCFTNNVLPTLHSRVVYLVVLNYSLVVFYPNYQYLAWWSHNSPTSCRSYNPIAKTVKDYNCRFGNHFKEVNQCRVSVSCVWCTGHLLPDCWMHITTAWFGIANCHPQFIDDSCSYLSLRACVMCVSLLPLLEVWRFPGRCILGIVKLRRSFSVQWNIDLE